MLKSTDPSLSTEGETQVISTSDTIVAATDHCPNRHCADPDTDPTPEKPAPITDIGIPPVVDATDGCTDVTTGALTYVKTAALDTAWTPPIDTVTTTVPDGCAGDRHLIWSSAT